MFVEKYLIFHLFGWGIVRLYSALRLIHHLYTPELLNRTVYLSTGQL